MNGLMEGWIDEWMNELKEGWTNIEQYEHIKQGIILLRLSQCVTV